jgi:hypothetical protein
MIGVDDLVQVVGADLHSQHRAICSGGLAEHFDRIAPETG